MLFVGFTDPGAVVGNEWDRNFLWGQAFSNDSVIPRFHRDRGNRVIEPRGERKEEQTVCYCSLWIAVITRDVRFWDP
jgi:hypothetical protein